MFIYFILIREIRNGTKVICETAHKKQYNTTLICVLNFSHDFSLFSLNAAPTLNDYKPIRYFSCKIFSYQVAALF